MAALSRTRASRAYGGNDRSSRSSRTASRGSMRPRGTASLSLNNATRDGAAPIRDHGLNSRATKSQLITFSIKSTGR